MTQYIDKAAVVAEIEGRLSLLEGSTGHPEVVKRVEGVIKAYKSILSFLDTLEVKEVDLEKETEHVKGDYEQADVAWNKDNNMKYIDTENLKSMIRERYNTYKIGQHSPFRNGKVETLREIIELIDSLQQEQPEWMASQGETAEVGYWNQRGLSLCLDKSLEKLGYKEGDKVIIQIRKK